MIKNPFLFLGYILPTDEMNPFFFKDQFPRVQTLEHNINLLKALEFNNKNLNYYVSTKPISDYPYNLTKFSKKKHHSIKITNKTINIDEVGFMNLSIIKVLTKFQGVFYLSLKKLIFSKEIKYILVYSTEISYLLVAYLSKHLFKKKIVIFITDSIQQESTYDNRLKSIFRKLNYQLSKKIILTFDKSIVVTKNLAKEYLPSKPYLIIEGIIDISAIEKNMNQVNIPKNLIIRSNYPDKSNIIVYAGSLSEIYGIKNLIDAMIILKDKPVILILYGKGDMVNLIEEYSAVNPNINYKGFIDQSFIHKVYQEADYLINVRPVDEEYTKYSFPSKILEYMLSGKPIITTFLPGISDEYNQFFIKLRDNSADTIAEKIISLIDCKNPKVFHNPEEEISFVKRNDYKSIANLLSNFLSD